MACSFYLHSKLDTQLASAPTKGNEDSDKAPQSVRAAEVTRTHPTQSGLPGQIVQVSFIKYTISFSIFPFLFYLFYKVNSLLTTGEHALWLKGSLPCRPSTPSSQKPRVTFHLLSSLRLPMGNRVNLNCLIMFSVYKKTPNCLPGPCSVHPLGMGCPTVLADKTVIKKTPGSRGEEPRKGQQRTW